MRPSSSRHRSASAKGAGDYGEYHLESHPGDAILGYAGPVTGSGFSFEALRELRGGDLDGDVTIQTCIASPINLAHATGPSGREDLVRTEFVAGGILRI
jgi:hypothetical protein